MAPFVVWGDGALCRLWTSWSADPNRPLRSSSNNNSVDAARSKPTPDLESPLELDHAVNPISASHHGSSSSSPAVVFHRPRRILQKKDRIALVLVYSGVGVTLALIVRVSSLAAAAASAFIAVLWLGFVLALSFLESWVKFRAPFVAEHLALDVGRTVAKAKHAAELGLVLGLWLVHVVGSAHFRLDATFITLASLKMLFAIQHRVLWPRLELRAEFALYDSLKNESPTESRTEAQWNEVDRITQLVKQVAEPPKSYEWAYFAVEAIKVVLLLCLSFHFLSELPKAV